MNELFSLSLKFRETNLCFITSTKWVSVYVLCVTWTLTRARAVKKAAVTNIVSNE